jgi:TonB family protein
VRHLLSTFVLITAASVVGCASTQKATEPPPAASAAAPSSQPSRALPASGRRSAAESNGVIREHRPEFRACYDRALAAHPGIAGKVEIAFSILPDGTVKDASVDEMKSETRDAGLSACLVSTVLAIKFPASTEEVGAKMHYPFDFKPGPVKHTVGDPDLQ